MNQTKEISTCSLEQLAAFGWTSKLFAHTQTHTSHTNCLSCIPWVVYSVLPVRLYGRAGVRRRLKNRFQISIVIEASLATVYLNCHYFFFTISVWGYGKPGPAFTKYNCSLSIVNFIVLLSSTFLLVLLAHEIFSGHSVALISVTCSENELLSNN